MESVEIVVDCFWVNPEKMRGIGLSSLFRLDLILQQSDNKIYVISSSSAKNFFLDRYRTDRVEIKSLPFWRYFLLGYSRIFPRKIHGNKLWLSLGNFPSLSKGGIEFIIAHDFAWNKIHILHSDYKKIAYRVLLHTMYLRSSKAKFMACVDQEYEIPQVIRSYSEVIQSIGNPVRYYDDLRSNDKDFDAIVVGPNSPIKRLELVPRIIDKLDNINNLVIIGYKEEWCTKLKCNITFTGVVSDVEVQQYISKSKRLIITSSSESFSYPIHYAIYYGCDIIGAKDIKVRDSLKGYIRNVGI